MLVNLAIDTHLRILGYYTRMRMPPGYTQRRILTIYTDSRIETHHGSIRTHPTAARLPHPPSPTPSRADAEPARAKNVRPPSHRIQARSRRARDPARDPHGCSHGS